jgi:hypothetical protein
MSRTVFLIGPWAIKVPSLRNGQRFFLKGLLGNQLEYEHWKSERHKQLGQVLWCLPFGIMLCMRRYYVFVDRQLTPEEKTAFPFLNVDAHSRNIAFDHGIPTLIDYGNIDYLYYLKGRLT